MPTANTVKCVDVVPGASRYCSSALFGFGKSNIGGTLMCPVVYAYDDMGTKVDRIVQLNSITITIFANVSQGTSAYGDFTVGSFDEGGTVTERVGRYTLPFDDGHIEVPGPFGAVVVHGSGYFGVRVNVDKLSEETPDTFDGYITVNIEFSVVGHSL